MAPRSRRSSTSRGVYRRQLPIENDLGDVGVESNLELLVHPGLEMEEAPDAELGHDRHVELRADDVAPDERADVEARRRVACERQGEVEAGEEMGAPVELAVRDDAHPQ